MSLKIDYAAIIVSANLRKERLQQIEEKLATIQSQADQLKEVLTYFAELGDLVKSLDHEGQQVLGLPIAHSCIHFTTVARSAYDNMCDSKYADETGLTPLLKALE